MIIFILLCFLLITNISGQQSKIDSLVNLTKTYPEEELAAIYNAIAREYLLLSPDQSLRYSETALSFAQKSNNTQEEIRAYKSIISFYFNKQDFSKVIKIYSPYVSLLRKTNGTKKLIQALEIISKSYFFIGDYQNSLKYSIEANKKAKIVSDHPAIYSSAYLIGYIQRKLDNYNLALHYFQEASEAAKKTDNLSDYAACLNEIGNVYFYLNNFQKAIKQNELAIKYAKTSGDNFQLASCLNDIACKYYSIKKLDSALQNFNKAYLFFNKTKSRREMILSLINMGTISCEIGNFQRAEQYYLKAIQLADSGNFKIELSDSYKTISEIYAIKGDYKNAFEALEKSYSLNDTLYTQEKSKQITEVQAKYETEKKENEIAILQKNKEIQELELNKQKLLRNSFMGGFVLILIIALVINNRYGIKKKANAKLIASEKKLAELNAAKDKFFTIISHDLKSPFTSLLGSAELLLNDVQDMSSDEIKEFAGNIHKSSNSIYNLLENLLSWSMIQTGKLKYNPSSIILFEITAEVIFLFEKNAEAKNIQLINYIPKDVIVFADYNMLNTVLRNLISNAIKFTNEAGTITIESKMKNNNVEITVADTGTGMDEEISSGLFKTKVNTSVIGTNNEKGTGLGLLLCKEMIEMNHGQISCESKKGKGTKMIFTLPVCID